MRTKMPDELKVGDRLYIRGPVTTQEAITAITPTHLPIGQQYLPMLLVTVTGSEQALVVDPRIAIEVV